MFALRFEDLMSSGETPYVRATSSMILPTVTGVGWSLLTMSLIARCAVLIVGVAPSTRWIALSFLDGALELADVALELDRDEFADVVRHGEADELGLALDDRHARFKIRRLYVGGQAPLEARLQTVSSVAMSRGGRSLVRTICFFDS